MDGRCTRSCFEVYSSRTVQRGGYEATINITSAGHVVTWRYQGMTLTEVAARPIIRCRKSAGCFPICSKGERNDRVECRGGVRYQMNFQLEAGRSAVVLDVSAGIGPRRPASRHAPPLRFQRPDGLGRLSYINVETRNRSLLVQAFHTFPDDYAIVKSQSLFEIP